MKNCKTLLILVLLGIVALSCTKPAVFDKPIGLISEYNTLSAGGGSTPIAVYSNTTWQVEFLEQVSWASLDRLSGELSGQVMFNFDANYGRSRYVVVKFSAAGQSKTLKMFQKAAIANADVILEFDGNSLDIDSSKATLSQTFHTNLIYQLDQIRLEVVYPDGQESVNWVDGVSFEFEEGSRTATVHFTVEGNATGDSRSAYLRLYHIDGGDSCDAVEGTPVYSERFTINQAAQL